MDNDSADEVVVQNAMPSLTPINAFEDAANIKPFGCVVVKFSRCYIQCGEVFGVSSQMLDVGENRFGVETMPSFSAVSCFVNACSRFGRPSTCDDDVVWVSWIKQNPSRLFHCFLRQVAVYASPTHPTVS